MYNPVLLKEAFESLIGLRQPYVPGVPQVQDPLSISNTGVYVDDKHPLVSTENLYYSCPNFEPSQYPLWVSGGTYSLSFPVNYAGILYVSTQAMTGRTTTPLADTSYWTLYYPFQELLLQKYYQAVPNLFSEMFRKKNLLHMSKAILERVQLYRGGGSIYSKIIPQGRAVGFQITTQPAEGLWVFIDMIGIQLLNSQLLPVYIYHSDSNDFLGSWIYSAEEKTFKWIKLNVSVPWVSGSDYPIVGTIVSYADKYYTSRNALVGDTVIPPSDPTNWLLTREPANNCSMKYLNQNTSGSYLFVYYEDDLEDGNFALSKKWNCNETPCQGCDGVDLTLYNQWSRFTTFRTISVPASALNEDRTLFDLNRVSYDNATNWGINMSLTVRCDLTDFIIANIYQWTDVFAMQCAKEYMEMIANGIRIGPNPAQTKLSAIAALDPKAPGNWICKYNDAIDELNLNFSGFSNACMPCEKKGKAKNYTM